MSDRAPLPIRVVVWIGTALASWTLILLIGWLFITIFVSILEALTT